MTRLPLENNLENNPKSRNRSHTTVGEFAIAQALLNAIKTFWRFSQFHGEYQSTPINERYRKDWRRFTQKTAQKPIH